MEGRPQVKRALSTRSGGCLSGFCGLAAGAGVRGWLALPAGVVLGDGEAEFLEFGDELAEPFVVVEPGAVVGELVVGQDPGGGLPVFLAGPLVVGAVRLRGVGAAAAAAVAAAGHPVGDGAGQGEGEAGEAGGDLGGDGRGAGLLGRGGRHGVIVAARFPHLAHCIEYKCCMLSEEVAAYTGRWRPSPVSPRAAAFARNVITEAGPAGRERAKNLLQSAGKLADFGTGLGLEPVPGVLLHPSVTERFTRCAPGLSGVARRTLRTNLRFTGRRVVPQLYPADTPLPRERARKPYSTAEISGYLALAGAQPTAERRMRAAGLVCLGAGAGLIRGDLRDARGSDVACRSGGMVVAVRGSRPRTVPVLARYHVRLLGAAAFAGAGLICGGAGPGHRNLTNPLVSALDGGSGLPQLDTSRLRATWLTGCAQLLGLATFMHAAGISCSQRLGDLVAGQDLAAEAVRLPGAVRR
jgi:integrase